MLSLVLFAALAVYANAELSNLKPSNVDLLSQVGEAELKTFLESLDYQNALEKNIFVTLLPLYGGAKLSKLITQNNINAIKAVFEDNPQHWETLMVEFAKCDVFLPTLEASNWTMEKSDLDRIMDIFGPTATLADFFDDDYVAELEKCLDDHDTLIFLLEIIARFGAIIGHDADFDLFSEVASELLLDGDIILALFPTLVAMLVVALLPFGKRSLDENLPMILLVELIKRIPPSYVKHLARHYHKFENNKIFQILMNIVHSLIANLVQG